MTEPKKPTEIDDAELESVKGAGRTDDGKADIITAPGPGGGPHVRIFDGQDSTSKTERSDDRS